MHVAGLSVHASSVPNPSIATAPARGGSMATSHHSMIETGCCSIVDEELARPAPSVATAVAATLSGKDGI